MSDIADRADDQIINTVNDSIEEIRRKPSVKATGYCMYCAEPVRANVLFCCPDCQEDWEYEQRRKRVNGA